MSDIAEKLRELSRWLLATDTDIKMPDGMIDPEIAADYTEALEAYVAEKKLLAAENERLRAEAERLAAENEKISALRATCNCGGLETGNHFSDCPYALALETPRRAIEIIELRARVSELDEKADRLAAENERLRAWLREAFEVYANSEGFISETAAEGYQQQVIKQIINCTNAGLAALQDKRDE